VIKYASVDPLTTAINMFIYVSLGSNDLERAALFYDAVLEPLGLSRCDTSREPNWEGWVGWGTYELRRRA
jgi:hypothetical protein